MYPALSGSRGVSRGNTSRSPFLTARPGRFEVFQRETRAEASTGLKPLWCRSGGFKRKPEHDAHGAPEVGFVSDSTVGGLDLWFTHQLNVQRGRSSPRLANDPLFTHMLNVQRWEVFA